MVLIYDVHKSKKNMKRIFYFNITFICNNDCLFCFSHSTYYKKISKFSCDDIVQIINSYGITSRDRVIINGGEPTLCKELQSILQVLNYYGVEVVLYSNGRLFCNKVFCESVLKYITRVVIPIHGSREVHECITQKKGSFDETVQGLENIIQLGYADKIELKFIVSQKMIDESFSISTFMDIYALKIENIVISGQVETKVGMLYGFYRPNEIRLGAYVSKEIQQLLSEGHRLKLMDVELCCMEDSVKHKILMLPEEKEDIQYEYYYFDGSIKSGKLISYDAERSCNNCEIKGLCRSIMHSCKVLYIDKEIRKIILE